MRYGGKLGDYGFFRVYAKTSTFANTETARGAAVRDEWGRSQAGFRADWSHDADTFTLSADTYSGESEDRGTVIGIRFGSIQVSGSDVLGRWKRAAAGGSLEVQTYYDHTERDDLLFFRPYDDIFDVEVTHSIRSASTTCSGAAATAARATRSTPATPRRSSRRARISIGRTCTFKTRSN